MRLSVAVITFNEEKNIERLLNSVNDIADEIVVVDSFSTDKTKNICGKFNKVKFVPHQFEGYGPQKNFAIENCAGKWIFFPDADEIIDENAKKSISQIILQEDPLFKVYNVEFNNIFLGKTLKHGGWGKVWRERFFMRNLAKYSEDIVHEEFLTKEKIGKLQGRINHYTYENIHHHIEKSNKYTSMMAQKMFRNNKKSSVAKIIFKPAFQFLKSYFLRLGFLDGLVGFYAAVTASFYTFSKYMKLYEISQKK